MTTTYITEQMRAAVGSAFDTLVSFPVSSSDIRRWALAIYFPDPPPREFWDEEYARATAFGGVVAPEEFNPFAWMVAEPHGHRSGYVPGAPSVEARLGLDEVGTEFQLNGGTEIEYGVRMRPGDVISSATVLADYEEREGRLGTMLFTRFTDTWRNQDDNVVKAATSLLIRY